MESVWWPRFSKPLEDVVSNVPISRELRKLHIPDHSAVIREIKERSRSKQKITILARGLQSFYQEPGDSVHSRLKEE